MKLCRKNCYTFVFFSAQSPANAYNISPEAMFWLCLELCVRFSLSADVFDIMCKSQLLAKIRHSDVEFKHCNAPINNHCLLRHKDISDDIILPVQDEPCCGGPLMQVGLWAISSIQKAQIGLLIQASPVIGRMEVQCGMHLLGTLRSGSWCAGAGGQTRCEAGREGWRSVARSLSVPPHQV